MALTKITSAVLGNSAVTTAKLNLTTPLGIANSSANVLYMAANGNVGVGISTPGTKIQLNGSTTMGTGSATEDLLTLTNQNGVLSGVAGDKLGIVLSAMSDLSDRRVGLYSVAGNSNWNNPDFAIWQTGQGIAFRETFRIKADSGYVGIGTNAPSEKLQVNGNIYLNNYAAISRYGTGSSTSANAAELVKFGTDTQVYHDNVTLSSAGSAVVRFCGSRAELIRMRNNSGYAIYAENGGITSASDYRIKENITEIPDAWNKVKQINPVEYNLKESWNPEQYHLRQAGFLAHELQALLPSAVGGTKDEVDKDGNPVMQGVDYSKVTPLLAAALKQALYKIETLEAKVAALEGNA